MPMKNPPHPGDFIRTEIIEAAGLTVTAAAIALRVSRPTLSSLLNGKAGVSGDMALRIEKAFGVKMDTLMRMQSSYDIAQTRKRENQIRVPRFSVFAEFSLVNSSLQRIEGERERTYVWVFRFDFEDINSCSFRSLFTGSIFSFLLFFKWESFCMNSRD